MENSPQVKNDPAISKFRLNEEPIAFIQKNFTNSFKYRLMLMFRLPMGFLAGLRIKKLTKDTCEVTVPYKWLNKNPFRSTFWAVLGMAAEMSSGAMLIMYTYKQDFSLSTLVTHNTAKYSKKATGITTFVSHSGKDLRETIREAVETGEAREVTCASTGYDAAGDVVAEFEFTWSMKLRKNKNG